jgi:hypothetical protein
VGRERETTLRTPAKEANYRRHSCKGNEKIEPYHAGHSEKRIFNIKIHKT